MNIIEKHVSLPKQGRKALHNDALDWWRGAVIYQIYPRSFQDTNDDGVGDLAGITQRLAYIADLGVDAIWISPFFKSPMLDFGYDVSNYRAVDPLFGTMEDFDTMISKAHDLGLKVMIDQVISHTSDQHEWFKESRVDHVNPKADWYVWADAKSDGSPPNNWLSIFGGSAWEWDSSRCQYYLHNFLRSQPDLNFHYSEVQEQLLEEVRFWLERGVDGFRLDTVNFYFHSKGLEDNPALSEEERNASIAPSVNPYNFQNHLYDKSQAENIDFLVKFRRLLDEYGAAAVGEVGDAQIGLDLVSQYTSGPDRLQMCYSFDFLDSTRLSAQRARSVVEAFESVAPDGWSCWAFSNHDVERHASRWAATMENPVAFLKIAASVILTLRGSVCIYQGEELGLVEAELEFEDLQDPYGIQFWPKFKGRDGCRTPMVWSNDNSFGGFSNAKPWLPIPETHLNLAVNNQEEDKNSLLNHYRNMLRFRSKHLELVKGGIEFHDGGDDLLIFTRKLDQSEMLVIINISDNAVEFEMPVHGFTAIDDELCTGQVTDMKLNLPAFSTWFGKKEV